MSDVNCPYCGEPQEINHDDGYGYEEDRLHEQKCDDCNKAFTFTTSVHYYYEAEKADCLNGAPHQMEKVIHAGIFWPNWKRCKLCSREEGKYECEPVKATPNDQHQ